MLTSEDKQILSVFVIFAFVVAYCVTLMVGCERHRYEVNAKVGQQSAPPTP